MPRSFDAWGMKSKEAPNTRLPAKQPWHSVGVIGGTMACAAAVQNKGRRFLASEAPPIPLPDCTAPWRCKCVYRHYADRRATPRRIADRGMFGRHIGSERRQSRGRRAEDMAESQR
jgi:hypothetical protein